MTPLAAGLTWIDLEFLGRSHAIATAVIQGGGGVALIDPGPTSCLDTLELGLQQNGTRLEDVTDILLTHVHLDHAGATGTILRRVPGIRVFVHEKGAPHIIDPSRLVQSAARLYGDDMDRFWGEVAPVPAGQVELIKGGERIQTGGRTFDVAYTPGHASHHVSFFDSASGVAFVGDVGGMRVDGGVVLPPTPPPDIDLELWAASVKAIEAWSPSTLFRTHFGASNEVRRELASLLDMLDWMAALVRETLNEPGSDDLRSAAFTQHLRERLRREMTDAQLERYTVSAPFHLLWLGLARYWRKRA